jgi:hypothetical protein
VLWFTPFSSTTSASSCASTEFTGPGRAGCRAKSKESGRSRVWSKPDHTDRAAGFGNAREHDGKRKDAVGGMKREARSREREAKCHITYSVTCVLTKDRPRTGHSQKIVHGLKALPYSSLVSPDLNEVRVHASNMGSCFKREPERSEGS